MKARVDQEKCLGCALCVRLCPAVFEMDFHVGLSRVKLETVPESEREAAEEAKEKCPGKAIILS